MYFSGVCVHYSFLIRPEIAGHEIVFAGKTLYANRDFRALANSQMKIEKCKIDGFVLVFSKQCVFEYNCFITIHDFI